jgi:hypothetical protein
MNDTLIPAKTLARWTAISRRSALGKLSTLIEFRELIEDARAEGILMEVYAEAAGAMLCAPDTLRHDIGIIRGYAADTLINWISHGVSFDHIRTANELAEIAHKTPAKLLDECIDPGNSEGKVMTVDELELLALGEKKRNPAAVQINYLFDRLGKLANGWDERKQTAFQLDLAEFRKRWFSE